MKRKCYSFNNAIMLFYYKLCILFMLPFVISWKGIKCSGDLGESGYLNFVEFRIQIVFVTTL